MESRDIGLVGTRGPCESGRYSKTPMVNVISVEDLHIISFHMMFNLTAGLFYELSLSRLSREGGVNAGLCIIGEFCIYLNRMYI